LSWNNFESFDLNVFRIGNSNTLTIVCTVAVFANSNDMPDECEVDRRRRNTPEDHSINAAELSFTIPIADKEPKNSGSISQSILHVVFVLVFLVM